MTGKAFTAGRTRTALAVALAYVLALQALLLVTAGAVQAGAGHSPQGVLCVDDAGPVPDHPVPTQAHGALCCILSCHGPGASGAPLPSAAAAGRPGPTVLAADGVPEAAAPPSPLRILPVGSRAPPRLG
jgi:hypothetical protein